MLLFRNPHFKHVRCAVPGLICLFALAGSAQVTIKSADMPKAGDNILVSIQTSLTGFAPASTGAGQTWDFRQLLPDSQRTESFLKPSSTPYPFFGFLSTLGSPNHEPDPFPFILLGVQPENPYFFYRLTTGVLEIVAQGLSTGGQPLPILYSSPDVIFRFPLRFGNTDSSTSSYSFGLPGFGYYGKTQKRVNYADGWGTLLTPYDTFEVVRVHSVLTIEDTIYLDTLGFGLTLPRPLQHQYKWMAPGGRIPILQINTTDIFGTQTVTGVIYQDSLWWGNMNLQLTWRGTCPYSDEGSITTLMEGGKKPYSYRWSNGESGPGLKGLPEGNYTVTVSDAYGQAVTASAEIVTLAGDVACLRIPTAFTPNGDGINDSWRIRNIAEYPGNTVEIYNRWGSLIFRSEGYGREWDGTYDGERLPDGIYYYFISLDGNRKYNGSVTILR